MKRFPWCGNPDLHGLQSLFEMENFNLQIMAQISSKFYQWVHDLPIWNFSMVMWPQSILMHVYVFPYFFPIRTENTEPMYDLDQN